jgi:hypothetical protein
MSMHNLGSFEYYCLMMVLDSKFTDSSLLDLFLYRP